jgi:FKBP-type peptidyl-prolyl cis-trans isomerase FklB
MKVLVAVTAAFAVCMGLASCDKSADGGDSTMKTLTDSASYAIGTSIGKQMKKDSIAKITPDLVVAGIRDAFAGKEKLTEEQLTQIMDAFQKEMQMKHTEMQSKAGEANKSAGEAFLAENAKKPGVKTLPSGLQYEVITEGTGPSPQATDEVVTKYRGTLIDGTEFDNSEKHGGTATFAVNQVVPGWTEALQLMKVGSKWKLYVPSNLAYGEQGMGQEIGPNSALIFDIELLEIKSK